MSAVRECRTGGSPANFKRACACCNNPCRSSTKSRSSQFIGRICVIVRVRGIPSHVYENRKHSHCPFPSMMSGQSARLAKVIIYITRKLRSKNMRNRKRPTLDYDEFAALLRDSIPDPPRRRHNRSWPKMLGVMLVVAFALSVITKAIIRAEQCSDTMKKLTEGDSLRHLCFEPVERLVRDFFWIIVEIVKHADC